MKILADENIPLLTHGFGHAGTLITKPGREITAADCRDIDILLVRSITPVNADLLANSSVRFVGSATTGSDHLDTDWLNQKGITWAVAAGCNTHAVVNYVICTIAALQKMNYLCGKKPVAAIIGVGRIGQSVSAILKKLGFKTLLCDPYRDDIATIPLDEIHDVDFITLHTPLTVNGDYPTFHMINQRFLKRQKPGCIILNTGRGATILTDDLRHHGQQLQWCLDVYEHEPQPALSIIEDALISTPHIAGYSVQAKWCGTEMLYHAAIKAGFIQPALKGLPGFPRHSLSFDHQRMDWRDVVLEVFDPRITSDKMKKTLRHAPNHFDQLRKEFITRHEFNYIDIHQAKLSPYDLKMLRHFGFVVH